jgi:hypothetical protein
MESGVNSQWRVNKRFVCNRDGYSIKGLKYVSPDGEVGWHITSWPRGKDLGHWVRNGTFHSVDIEVDEFRAGISPANISEQTEDVEQAERKAVLAAIESWGGDRP